MLITWSTVSQNLDPEVFAGTQPYSNIDLESWILVILHHHSEEEALQRFSKVKE